MGDTGRFTHAASRLGWRRRLSPLGRPLVRERVGLVVLVLGVALGVLDLLTLFVAPLVHSATTADVLAIVMGLSLAVPSGLVYVGVLRLLDRYDPEPGWAVLAVSLWGAFFAAGVSAAVSSGTAPLFREVAGALPERAATIVLGAPFVEEITKGLAVAGVFFFLRREFDGAVDGVIYGTYAGIGFSIVENAVLFTRAGLVGASTLTWTFVLRSLLTPWGHPLYTAMTGLGFGLAREAKATVPRVVAPIAGFVIAVTLHTIWNLGLVVSVSTGVPLAAVLFPLWAYFLALFATLLVALVKRKGWVLRHYLEDEVAAGRLTASELAYVTSPWAPRRARFGPGGLSARAFVRTAARLAMVKWHSERAQIGGSRTFSDARIAELRKHLAELRKLLPDGGLEPLSVRGGSRGAAGPTRASTTDEAARDTTGAGRPTAGTERA